MMRTNDFPSVRLTERNDLDQEALAVPKGSIGYGRSSQPVPQ
jgi:hypothetical protein